MVRQRLRKSNPFGFVVLLVALVVLELMLAELVFSQVYV